ncbi:hypothetical protein E1263_26675 [Kribbella antibiotica]|uniref:Lipoprotein n=1 Tax=Kribbella antibiotica TaxID=190195 RepID=A0A4V2YNN7_9ACTN|nr:hypothetical protein [Kribbella antibiotica]TDD54917.1 hypothetical protein E1263_26675 [Kribbella antibiotica]
MRRWVGIFLAVSSSFVLVGCGPGTSGTLGLMTDGNGNTSAVLQICEGHLENVVLNLQNRGVPEDPDEEPERLGEWESGSKVRKGFTQFDLAQGGNGWKVVTPLKPRNAARTFSITAASEDSAWIAFGPQFKNSDLTKLKPGQVLVSPEDGSPGNRVQSLDDFKATSCDGY